MYVRMHIGQRLEEHRHMEVDHAWASELLKLDYELLFQTGLLWLAKLSLHTRDGLANQTKTGYKSELR